MPRHSSISALPDLLEIERLPCLTTRAPAAAASNGSSSPTQQGGVRQAGASDAPSAQRVCWDFQRGTCSRSVCRYAHVGGNARNVVAAHQVRGNAAVNTIPVGAPMMGAVAGAGMGSHMSDYDIMRLAAAIRAGGTPFGQQPQMQSFQQLQNGAAGAAAADGQSSNA